MTRFEFSDELLERLAGLSHKQRAAIPRLAEVLGEGGSVRSLLFGDDKICTERTYYRRGRGWAQQPAFQAALALAQREYSEIRLQHAVEDAVERMRRATPTAVELAEAVMLAALRGGDEFPGAIESLLNMARTGQVATGQVRAASVLVNQGLRAALGILDRADIKTAMKAAGDDGQLYRDWLDEMQEIDDEDWEDGEKVAELETEAGDVPAAGVRAARGAEAGASEPGESGFGGGGGTEWQEPLDRE